MVLCVIAIAVVNLGLGFAIALYLARKYRAWVAAGNGLAVGDSGDPGFADGGRAGAEDARQSVAFHA